MRRHNVFTFGIILTTIYSINAMAAWPTTPATDIWTNSNHTTRANLRCSDCCKTDCWLPDGTYYDAVGQFTNSCEILPACPSGQYDIGFSGCTDASTNGTDYGYWDFGGDTSGIDKYALTKAGQWAANFSYGTVKGIASCNSTGGTGMGEVTDADFSSTANGQYCWCKMTSPAESSWVYNWNLTSSSDCRKNCVYTCGRDTMDEPILRSGLFSSGGSLAAAEPTCVSGKTYSVVDGKCTWKKSCPEGTYDIGTSECVGTSGVCYGGGITGSTWGCEGRYYGTEISGESSCNSTPGTQHITTTINFTSGGRGTYCWCKMTSPTASLWVYTYEYDTSTECRNDCADSCRVFTIDGGAFADALFGSVPD